MNLLQMINKYKVNYGITHIGAGSFEGSLSKRNSELKRLKSQFQSEIVSGYEFNGGELNLIFSELNCKLSIEIVENQISVSKKSIDDKISLSYCDFFDENDDETYFEFPSGGVDRWAWRSTLDKFVGKRLGLSLSNQNAFIYTIEDRKEYKISYVIVSERDYCNLLTITEV